MKVTPSLVFLAVAIGCLFVAWTLAVPDFLFDTGNLWAWLTAGLLLWATSHLVQRLGR